mmetsp:Transcript_16535/g.52004  ORF Transcript_16535/g.52004 Transcript_16535/m.52004 type:complete len:475 (-) Transcript_16535:152-1576(-)
MDRVAFRDYADGEARGERAPVRTMFDPRGADLEDDTNKASDRSTFDYYTPIDPRGPSNTSFSAPCGVDLEDDLNNATASERPTFTYFTPLRPRGPSKTTFSSRRASGVVRLEGNKRLMDTPDFNSDLSTAVCHEAAVADRLPNLDGISCKDSSGSISDSHSDAGSDDDMASIDGDSTVAVVGPPHRPGISAAMAGPKKPPSKTPDAEPEHPPTGAETSAAPGMTARTAAAFSARPASARARQRPHSVAASGGLKALGHGGRPLPAPAPGFRLPSLGPCAGLGGATGESGGAPAAPVLTQSALASHDAKFTVPRLTSAYLQHHNATGGHRPDKGPRRPRGMPGPVSAWEAPPPPVEQPAVEQPAEFVSRMRRATVSPGGARRNVALPSHNAAASSWEAPTLPPSGLPSARSMALLALRGGRLRRSADDPEPHGLPGELPTFLQPQAPQSPPHPPVGRRASRPRPLQVQRLPGATD